MKKSLKFILIFAAIGVFIWACSSNDDTMMVDDDVSLNDDVDPTDDGSGSNDDDDGDTTGGAIEMIDIQVILPEDSSIDLSQTVLLSAEEELDIDLNGQITLSISGSRHFAILADTDLNPLLWGFVREGSPEISVRSTVEGALYFALGTAFMEQEIKEVFFENAIALPEFQDLITTANTLFVEYPGFLDSPTFLEELTSATVKIIDDGSTIDIRPVVNFDGNDIRSGLQLNDSPGDALIISNSIRRRSHAFVYKTEIKDRDDQRQILIDQIGSNTRTDLQSIVSPAESINGFLGVVQKSIQGKGIEFARKESNPINLALTEEENEAIYAVRVVGPGIGGTLTSELTNEERERFLDLNIETLGFDIVLPILLAQVGEEDFLKDFKTNGSIFIEAFKVLVGSLPTVNDALLQGDFQKASSEFFTALLDGGTSSLFEPLLEAFANDLASNGGIPQAIKIDKLIRFLGITDKFLQGLDLGRIIGAAATTNVLEEWQVTSTRNPVQILPPNGTAIQSEAYPLRAFVQNANLGEGQFFEYTWSTYGNFGVLRNPLNNDEGVMLPSTTSETVDYFSSSSIELTENAVDSVFVEVFLRDGANRMFVNKVGAEIKIKELGFEIVPGGVTLKGGNNIVLSVKNTDGTDPLEESNLDYRFVWETTGRFGNFNSFVTQETIVNDNSIRYDALELEDDGVETVTVGIYTRSKGSNESFIFVDRISSEINIENDENTIQFEVPGIGGPVVAFPETGGTRTLFQGGFRPIPYIADAVRYEIEVIEYSINGTVIESATGLRRTWTNESQTANISTISLIQTAGNPNVTPVDDPTTGFALGLTGASINTINNQFENVQSDFASIRGRAIVTITLQN